MNLTREEKILIAKGLDAYRLAIKSDRKTLPGWYKVEEAEIHSLAVKLELDGDYFDYHFVPPP